MTTPREFLRHLKHKAGWPADFWAADLEAWRYETEVMAAERPAAPGDADTRPPALAGARS